MNIIKQGIFSRLFVVIALVALYSCDKTDSDPDENEKYIISSEIKTSISTKDAVANFTALSPELAPGLSFLIKSDVEIRKVVYKTSFQDKTIQASGLVCLPKNQGNYPIFSFQNGTNTMHSEAPTESYNDELFSLIGSIAAMGFVVIIPDYIGFGASANISHPYIHAKSSNQSILDFIRATKELCLNDKINAKTSNDLFLFGYSQGGWATLNVQKDIETNYKSEFNLVASSCGAGPYSIDFLNSYITSQPEYKTPYFLAYVVNSYRLLGLITNPLTDYFNEPYASKIPGLFDGKHTGGSINAALTPNLANLFTPEYLTQYSTSPKFLGLRTAMTANSIEAWDIQTPTRLYHGANDQVIPVSMSQKMFADLKTRMSANSNIELRLITIPEADHLGGVYPSGLETILWFLSLKK